MRTTTRLLRRTWLASMLTICWCLTACAQSPPPAPRDTQGKDEAAVQQAQPENQAVQTERGTTANPLIVREAQSDTQAAEDRDDGRADQASRRYALALSVLTTVAIFFQVWLLMRQNKIIAGQSTIMDGQRTAAVDALATTKVTERAYVSITHHPPGMTFSANGQPSISFVFHNTGNTPAEVVAFSLAVFNRTGPHRELPVPASYATREARHFIIMPRDSASVMQAGPTGPFTVDPQEVAIGAITLYMVAYIEYLDRFGARHRSGYARRYVPGRTPDNLVYVEQPGYNYNYEVDADGQRR